MRDQSDDLRLPLVISYSFAGEPEQQVPSYDKLMISSPLQKPDIVQTSGSFSHQVKDSRTQAFDSRLNNANTTLRQDTQLIRGEVRLYFEEECVVLTLLGE